MAIEIPDLKLTDLPKPMASLIQRQLKAMGLYQGTTMGIPGPATLAAYRVYLDRLAAPTATAQAASAVLRDAFVRIARSQIGVTEQGGNNRGDQVQEYQDAASWLPGTGWAWCAAFVGWCFDKLAEQYKLPFATPEGAGAFWYEDWARQQRVAVLPASARILAGDLIIYNFSHIDIATEDESGGRYTSVGGNTNAVNARDGDGVWEKPKAKATARIRSIIRPFP